MKIGRVLILYNPHSGKKNGQVHARRIERRLVKRGVTVTIYKSESLSGMGEYFSEIKIKNDAPDAIVIIGGDGTVGPVADAVIKNSLDVPLYCFGRGTANDFSSFLRTNCCVHRAVKKILAGNCIEADTLLINGHDHAINVACGGAFTNGVTKYDALGKLLFGKLAYMVKAFFASFRMQSQILRFTVDGKTFDLDVFIFSILNSKNVGGLRNSSPPASICDGLLDLICIKRCGLVGKLRVAGARTFGRLHKCKHVLHIQGTSFCVEHLPDAVVKHDFTLTDTDGNAGPAYPIEVTVGRRVRIIV